MILLHSSFRARELCLLSKPSAFPCPHWPRDPPSDQWGRWLEPQQPIRGGCCNASRGHYCSSTAGRRNAAEEGGDVGAGLAEQEHQQVRKYPDSFLLFSDKRFWHWCYKRYNWLQNYGSFSPVMRWISGVRWQWFNMVGGFERLISY